MLNRAKELGAPILISANTLWDNRRKRFRDTESFRGVDLALDSGGFVAMKRYGGYRWTVGQYADLARKLGPTWYAQMDYCCEPEIASERSAVFRRIDLTVEGLNACEAAASQVGIAAPMPVLQGWKPEDYCTGPIFERGADWWPSLVGVGSVCRRQVNGPEGLLAVVAALDAKLPRRTKLHLFGVKSLALDILATEFPGRVESIDSMAWAMRARFLSRTTGRNAQQDADVMAGWYLRQRARTEKTETQLTLELEA